MINLSHMFNDDTFESKTFILTSDTETYYVEYDHVFIQQLKPQIDAAIASGEGYITTMHLNLIYHGRYWDDKIIEITWD